MSKDDPLDQSASDQVREQMGKHTLWLNAENWSQMVLASYTGFCEGVPVAERPSFAEWQAMCAAALAVDEWRLSGRVLP
jgi:hypothetical protein